MPAVPRTNMPLRESVETSLRLETGKKPRIGARGQRKVKSGCRTCKIRHKRCNEARPSCLQCSSTGRKCDFSTLPAPAPSSHAAGHERRIAAVHGTTLWHHHHHHHHHPSNLPSHMGTMNGFEASNFEYFRHVCARDFALYFESARWEGLVLRYALTEASIYHAALAISTMSRTNYYPPTSAPSRLDPGKHMYNPTQSHSAAAAAAAAEYCLSQYTLAIQRLNARLDSSVASVELAAFASILFIYIEGMQGYTRSMHVHLRGGLALVQSLLGLESPSPNAGHLEWALHQIRAQVEQIEAVGGDLIV